jgi:hypothetical protein
MHRIAAALLIAAAVLALNGGMLREAFAAPAPAAPAGRVEIGQPIETRGSRILSLVLVLEALRQAGPAAADQKV